MADFGDGILIGMLLGIGSVIWWWAIMRYGDMNTFRRYFLQLDVATKNEVVVMLKELRERTRIITNKTNSRLFKSWYNTLIDINSSLSKKL